MNAKAHLYRLAELISNTVNPRATRKLIITKLGYDSRTTFYNKMNAIDENSNRFTTGEEELIAEELGVAVSEIFQQTLQPA